MPRKTPGPPCSVCKSPSVAKGLCDKHYRKLHQFGDPAAKGLRPADWGKKSNHPLHEKWLWTNRTLQGRDSAWNNFWTFVSDVGEPPGEGFILRRLDASQPFGPDNWFWSQVAYKADGTLAARELNSHRQRVWRAKNPYRTKHHDLKKNYGITLADYERMLSYQDGGCAICARTSESMSKRHLSVDHCHETKVIRGLLCDACNRAIGLLGDDTSRLERAIVYLRRDRSQEPA